MEAKTEEQVRLHFMVHDTGIGIAPEKQTVIFAPSLKPTVPRRANSAAQAWD